MDDLAKLGDDELFAYMRERKPAVGAVREGQEPPLWERSDEYMAAMKEAERRGFSEEEINRKVWEYWEPSN